MATQLTPYRRGTPSSLPGSDRLYLDRELGKLERVSASTTAALRDILFIDIRAYGADTTKSAAENAIAIQAAIDANPNRNIVIAGGGTYNCLPEIVLTDATHGFNGNIMGDGFTSIAFSDTGGSGNSDATMVAGFRSYKRTNSDVDGLQRSVMSGLRLTGPANGASIYAANSTGLCIHNNTITSNRYGIVIENSVNPKIDHNVIGDFKNAGVGLLSTGNTLVYSSTGAHFNDGVDISHNGFYTAITGSIAAILDHGTLSFGPRTIFNNFFSGSPYGYITRNAQPNIDSNWFEAVAHPIVFLNTSTAGNLAGVTACQPSGTYARALIPNGYSYGARISNNEASVVSGSMIDVSGIAGGPAYVHNNKVQALTGYLLLSTDVVNVVDFGNVVIGGSLGYSNLYNRGIGISGIPSADPSTLDDYHELAWTPVLNGFTVGGVGGVTATGQLTKIGNRVLWDLQLVLDAGATLACTGAYITGLPYLPTSNSSFSISSQDRTRTAVGMVHTSGTIATADWAASAAGASFAAGGQFRVS